MVSLSQRGAAVALLLALGLSACGLRENPMQLDGGGDDAGIATLDGGPVDAGPPAPLPPDDGGCPPPARITPDRVPTGYFPAEPVTLDHPTDGDTSSFRFSAPTDGGLPYRLTGDGGVQIIRYLYINTEEAYGPETTDFGVQTKNVTAGYLRAASSLHVAVRDNRGAPALDPYQRWLGLVFLNGELYDTRIVREGLSAYYTLYGCAPEPIHTALLYAEAEARVNKRGIWAPGHPTDYSVVLNNWILGGHGCRPNPYQSTACR